VISATNKYSSAAMISTSSLIPVSATAHHQRQDQGNMMTIARGDGAGQLHVGSQVQHVRVAGKPVWSRP
jgi:hypothetical protein